MIEQSISFESSGNVLRGTLSMLNEKKQNYPAVLILSGSGPLNRDGNDAKGKLQLNLYKQLASFITSLGFITLRYDKRGIGESEGDYFSAGMWDLVHDAKSAVQFLKNHPLVDDQRIIVLGHSEGTTLAVALNTIERIHGLILLAGAGERLQEALLRQRKLAYQALNNLKGIKGKLMRMLNIEQKNEKKAEALFNKILQTDKDVIKVQFRKINAKWFREHLQYDVLQYLEKVECSTLAITGDKDIQANPEKLNRLPKLVKGDLEYYTIKNMDHGLKKQEDEVNILKIKKIYKENASKPLHDELCFYLQKWLNDHYKSEQSSLIE
ncbi:alpha/beta hydrolase [Thermaerobacillus caldiproteolyticus]|uniref:alpha/beta hydrolase n=1 Tax=Thermaerobacillus caldiproteolyticus TaxID=247480 RepID=UPI00188AF3D7|nr:alpha/beta hydrolase [Anoxybacillus caldiproteolyticus]QPA32138.1 alpha/beta hydrolase [Anoxybacillus caldiproteolyticus]